MGKARLSMARWTCIFQSVSRSNGTTAQVVAVAAIGQGDHRATAERHFLGGPERKINTRAHTQTHTERENRK
jgi:hypothetical protein